MKTAEQLCFLTIHGSYQELSIGLFQGRSLIAYHAATGVRLSAVLLEAVAAVLAQGGVSLENLDFIAVDQGPGSFNSLRALLASLNGLAYVSDIPLIGLDGLAVMRRAFACVHQGCPYIHAVLLNAYNNEVFYAIDRPESGGVRALIGDMTYDAVEIVGATLNTLSPHAPVCLTGNGVHLLQESSALKAFVIVALDGRVYMNALVEEAMVAWDKGCLVSGLQPLYLKETKFTKLSS